MIALLLQAKKDNELVQVILAPNSSTKTVQMFTRTVVPTAQRNRWTSMDQISQLVPAEVTTAPVAIRMTSQDEYEVAQGKATSVSVKLLSALDKGVSDIEPQMLPEFVLEVHDRLMAGDNSLCDYLNDSRYTTTPNLVDMRSAESSPREIDGLTGSPIEQKSANALSMQLARIPSADFAKSYVNRTLNGMPDFEVLDVALDKGFNVVLFGHAGSGKTTLAQAYASHKQMPFYSVPSSIGTDPSQLFGKFVPTCDGKFEWIDGGVTSLVKHGGILLINEITFMPDKVATSLFSLLDYRRELTLMDHEGEVIKAHPNLLIIADYNPQYRGSRELNEALNDRWTIKAELNYDKSVERKLIKQKSVLELADRLRTMFEERIIVTPVSTRNLVAFVQLVEALGIDFAINNYANNFKQGDERIAVVEILNALKSNMEADFGLQPKIDVDMVFQGIEHESELIEIQELIG